MKMVSIGNKAKLVKSGYCQKCAKCCKEFNCSFDLDCALRFKWIDDRKIKARDTPFIWNDGKSEKIVCFKRPCINLQEDRGVYSCMVWNDKRPDFCNTYPDHLFYGTESWNTEKIKRQLENGSKDCPALKDVSVEDVVKMLKELREEND